MNLKDFRFTIIIVILSMSSAFANSNWTCATEIKSNKINCLMTSGSTVFAGTADSGLYLSTDSRNHWSSANVNLQGKRILNLECSRNTVVATTNVGSFFSNNNGTSWLNFRASVPNQPDSISYYALCDSVIIAETVRGKAYKFTYETNPSPWIQINDTFLDAGHPNTVAFFEGNIILGTTFRVYYSTDQGISWRVAQNNTNTQGISSIVKSGRMLFAVSDGPCLSYDNGLTWDFSFTGLPSRTIGCESFSISGITGNDSIVLMSGSLWCMGGEGGLYMTNDHISGWRRLSNNTKIGYRSIWGNNVFAEIDSTLFIDTNQSTSWTNMSGNLPRDQISGVVVSGNSIIVGTKSNGAWSRPLSDFVGVQTPQNRSSAKSFGVNLTGGFERNIALNFSLDHPSHISAAMFDIAGHQVARLFEGNLGAGKKQIQCKQFNLSPGFYAIQVFLDRDRLLKKVTLF